MQGIFIYRSVNRSLPRFIYRSVNRSLPGQCWLLQVLTPWVCPVHLRPPFEGTGLLHVLERVWLPSPHGTEQTDHPDQLLQPPLTVNENYNVGLICFCSLMDYNMRLVTCKHV